MLSLLRPGLNVQFRGRLLYLRASLRPDRNMTSGERGLNPQHPSSPINVSHESSRHIPPWLFLPTLAAYLRQTGWLSSDVTALVFRVRPLLQFNLVSTPLLCPVALPLIVHPPDAEEAITGSSSEPHEGVLNLNAEPTGGEVWRDAESHGSNEEEWDGAWSQGTYFFVRSTFWNIPGTFTYSSSNAECDCFLLQGKTAKRSNKHDFYPTGLCSCPVFNLHHPFVWIHSVKHVLKSIGRQWM